MLLIWSIFFASRDRKVSLILIISDVLTCYMQVYLSGNNVSVVKSPLNHTSLPSIVATFLTTCLMAVL